MVLLTRNIHAKWAKASYTLVLSTSRLNLLVTSNTSLHKNGIL
jgi:hypothetical protein